MATHSTMDQSPSRKLAVTLSIELDRLTRTRSELDELKVGNLLGLSDFDEHQLTLIASGTEFAKGRLVTVSGETAFQITEFL